MYSKTLTFSLIQYNNRLLFLANLMTMITRKKLILKQNSSYFITLLVYAVYDD